jgi:hypothetical protein
MPYKDKIAKSVAGKRWREENRNRLKDYFRARYLAQKRSQPVKWERSHPEQITAGFYVYLWLREDGTPYYVGKGIGDRAFRNSGHVVHKPVDFDRILILPRDTEAKALASEIELIGNWGRKDAGTGCLRNHTDGGENPPSWRGRKRGPQSVEHRRHASEAHKGCRGFTGTHSEETKEKMRLKKLGKAASDETRRRMSESGKAAWLRRKARGIVQLSNL